MRNNRWVVVLVQWLTVSSLTKKGWQRHDEHVGLTLDEQLSPLTKKG